MLAPVVAGFVAGYALRSTGVATAREGDFLFLLNMYVCLPALVFLSLARVEITVALMVFPAAALVMVGTGYLCGRGIVALRGLRTPQAPVVVMGFMMVNSAFALPFAEALYGPAGVARIAAFDAVNTTLVFTAAYAVAARGNPLHRGESVLVSRILRTPPLYAIALGLLANLAGVSLPQPLVGTLSPFAAATPVLIALGTGIAFRPVRGQFRSAGRFALTRVLVGLAVGVSIVLALGLDGPDRGVLLLLSVSPLAFFSVTFASLENLDVDLAAQSLAVSLLAGFVLATLIGITVG